MKREPTVTGQLRAKGWLAMVLILMAAGIVLLADEKLYGIACRSVHLAYPGPEGTAFYNEVTIEKSARGTYFCVCGFNQGYYGLQELGNGKKLLIFSVWDPGKQNDPKVVEEEQRVKLVYHDPAVRIGRFGGEGTGGQSFYDFDWQAGMKYRLLVTAAPEEERTEYTGWFWDPAKDGWRRLVTFSTLTNGKLLKGYYSFVEDFRRNGESAKIVRQAWYENGWVCSTNGQWTALSRAQFTADSNPATNINARAVSNRFQLATGGETGNTDTKLREFMNCVPKGLELPEPLGK